MRGGWGVKKVIENTIINLCMCDVCKKKMCIRTNTQAECIQTESKSLGQSLTIRHTRTQSNTHKLDSRLCGARNIS